MLAVLHAGAGVIAALLPLAAAWRLALFGFVMASLYRMLRLHALRRSADAVVGLALEGDETCAVRRRGAAAWEEGRIVDRWLHPRLALLVIRCAARRLPVNVVIPGDGVSAEAFRRLRVRLRLQTAAD